MASHEEDDKPLNVETSVAPREWRIERVKNKRVQTLTGQAEAPRNDRLNMERLYRELEAFTDLPPYCIVYFELAA